MRLQCPSRIQARIRSDGLLEILCKEKWCKQDGQVVFHCFNLETGVLVKTIKYKDPNKKARSFNVEKTVSSNDDSLFSDVKGDRQ